jgi:hypothetical protein
MIFHAIAAILPLIYNLSFKADFSLYTHSKQMVTNPSAHFFSSYLFSHSRGEKSANNRIIGDHVFSVFQKGIATMLGRQVENPHEIIKETRLDQKRGLSRFSSVGGRSRNRAISTDAHFEATSYLYPQESVV